MFVVKIEGQPHTGERIAQYVQFVHDQVYGRFERQNFKRDIYYPVIVLFTTWRRVQFFNGLAMTCQQLLKS
jgi:hypothetical protein